MTNSQARVQELLAHDWTILREDVGNGELALTIAELPDFLIAGTESDVEHQFWSALEGYLEVAVDHGHALPDASGREAAPIIEAPIPRITTQDSPSPVVQEPLLWSEASEPWEAPAPMAGA